MFKITISTNQRTASVTTDQSQASFLATRDRNVRIVGGVIKLLTAKLTLTLNCVKKQIVAKNLKIEA